MSKQSRSLYAMELHESLFFGDHTGSNDEGAIVFVIRVPGGWLYTV